MGQFHSGPMAGRTVLVSGGIGTATALGLARMGVDLAICGRDPRSTLDTAGELSAAGGGVRGRPARPGGGAAAGRPGLQSLPRIEVLVNNVGGTGTPAMSPPTGWSAPSPQPSGAVHAHQPAPRPIEAERPGAGGHRLLQRPSQGAGSTSTTSKGSGRIPRRGPTGPRARIADASRRACSPCPGSRVCRSCTRWPCWIPAQLQRFDGADGHVHCYWVFRDYLTFATAIRAGTVTEIAAQLDSGPAMTSDPGWRSRRIPGLQTTLAQRQKVAMNF